MHNFLTVKKYSELLSLAFLTKIVLFFLWMCLSISFPQKSGEDVRVYGAGVVVISEPPYVGTGN